MMRGTLPSFIIPHSAFIISATPSLTVGLPPRARSRAADVPQLHGLIRGGAGQRLAVGREGDGVDATARLQIHFQLARPRVPDFQLAFGAVHAARDEPPVGTEDNRTDDGVGRVVE